MRRLATATIGGATLMASLLFARPALADIGIGPPEGAVTFFVVVLIGVVIAGVVALSVFVLRDVSRSRREARAPCRNCGRDVAQNASYCLSCGAAQTQPTEGEDR